MRATVSAGTLLPVLLAAGLLLPTLAAADTIYLKNGGKIEQCRVLEEQSDHVVVRTRAGREQVPRSMIRKIAKKESVFDVHDKKVAEVEDGDAQGLFEVADWCRQEGGLRPEMYALLERALTADDNHAPTRHLLGHVWSGEKWIPLKPLEVFIRMENHDELRAAAKKSLNRVIEIRKDVALVDSITGKNPAHSCELNVIIKITKTKYAKYYRQPFKGPALNTLIRLRPAGRLAGSNPVEVKLRGEVSRKVDGPEQAAVGDAFGRKPKSLHRLFDELQRRRVELVEAALAKKAGKGTGDGEKGSE